jgi:predicted  nucleic acid-binding Zn-ribbon protein
LDLKKLQQLDLIIRDLRKTMEERPRQLGEQRGAIDTTSEDLQAKDREIQEVQIALDSLEVDLKEGEEKLQRSRILLNQAKSNDEYSVLQGQIKGQERKNSKTEEAILEKMSRLDDLRAERKALEAQQGKNEEEYRAFQGEVEREVTAVQAEIDRRLAEREQMVSTIDGDAVRQYERILEKREDGAIAAVSAEVCQGCFTRIPPQWINLLQIDRDLVSCPSCGRILYLED